MRSWPLGLKLFIGMITSLCGLATTLAEPIQSPVYSVSTPHDPEILIFVSFSMPIESLAQWSRQANRVQAPLVIRGLVNDSFVDTQRKVAEFSEKTQGGVVLDPRLLTKYGITQVPAVVVRRSPQPCPPMQSCRQDTRFDVVTGDVGLAFALQTIADQGEWGSEIAQHSLAQLRRYE